MLYFTTEPLQKPLAITGTSNPSSSSAQIRTADRRHRPGTDRSCTTPSRPRPAAPHPVARPRPSDRMSAACSRWATSAPPSKHSRRRRIHRVAHQKIADRRRIHGAVLLPLQPLIEPLRGRSAAQVQRLILFSATWWNTRRENVTLRFRQSFTLVLRLVLVAKPIVPAGADWASTQPDAPLGGKTAILRHRPRPCTCRLPSPTPNPTHRPKWRYTTALVHSARACDGRCRSYYSVDSRSSQSLF